MMSLVRILTQIRYKIFHDVDTTCSSITFKKETLLRYSTHCIICFVQLLQVSWIYVCRSNQTILGTTVTPYQTVEIQAPLSYW